MAVVVALVVAAVAVPAVAAVVALAAAAVAVPAAAAKAKYLFLCAP
ncbi:hypothetical protein [Mycobacterium montefiorense]|nr:hypothetical protein [Mycobacterium montefiorense]MCV7425138.1 hypothetical protein [Mycobacterium montefiorense]